MFLVGLTGGIASGKSTVAQVFIENGIPVIDADLLARKVVEPGKKAWKELKVTFGEDIFHENGELNRTKLGEIIFNNKDKRRMLNHITHPEIMKEILFETVRLGLSGNNYIVLDLPLLFEIGELVKFMHKIIVVRCESDQQFERLCDRNKLSLEHARHRIDSQMSLDKKCEMADFVVDNSGTIQHTIEQTKKVINYLNTLNTHWKLRFYFFFTVSLLVFIIVYLLHWYYRPS